MEIHVNAKGNGHTALLRFELGIKEILLPRFELGILDSKSSVITTSLQEMNFSGGNSRFLKL